MTAVEDRPVVAETVPVADEVLLSRPGVMRALWWARCPSCRGLIHGDTRCSCFRPHPEVSHCCCGQQHPGDVMGTSVVDGHPVWVCRDCYLAAESPT